MAHHETPSSPATVIATWLLDHGYVDLPEAVLLLADPGMLHDWLHDRIAGPPPEAPKPHDWSNGRPSATIGYLAARGHRARLRQHADTLKRHEVLDTVHAALHAALNPDDPVDPAVLSWWNPNGTATCTTLTAAVAAGLPALPRPAPPPPHHPLSYYSQAVQ